MIAPQPIRIGTRGSALALVQARLVAAALDSAGVPHELVVIETEGDRRAPDTAWGEGAFVAAIERALLDGRVDVAVHSAKDVPTDEDPRLAIAAFLPRADPLDALVLPAGSAATGLADLPAGSCVGTDSPRRAAFVRALRPDLEFRPLHGNVDTRLRRLDEGEADALVLAVAGLTRLGRGDRITERLDATRVPPAPGQGAIAVQVRFDDEPTRTAVSALDDGPTRLAVETERAFLRAAGGGCRAPIGALATVDGGRVRLQAGFAHGDATAIEAVEASAAAAMSTASELATRLTRRLSEGGRRPLVLVTRAAEACAELAHDLAEQGVEAVAVPAIAFEAVPPDGDLDRHLLDLAAVDWAVVTSVNGTRAVVQAARRLGVDLASTRWAAVGSASAAMLPAAGVREVWLADASNAAAIAAGLPVDPGSTVLVVRGSRTDDALPAALRERGCTVRSVVAYLTLEAPASSQQAVDGALAGDRLPDAVLFASGSAVRGLLALAGPDRRERLLAIPAICIGGSTARVAEAAGFRVLGTSDRQSADGLADLTGRLLRNPGVTQ